MNKEKVLVYVATVAALGAVIGFFVPYTIYSNASTTRTISRIDNGTNLDQAIQAMGNTNVLQTIHAQRALVFTKAGGVTSAGETQRLLSVLTNYITVGSDNTLKFQYFVDVPSDATPSFSHCSDIRLLVLVDGHNVGSTDLLGYNGRSPALPLDTGKLAISNVQSGTHTLTLIPEGSLGGCNTLGYVYSWGGTLVIFN